MSSLRMDSIASSNILVCCTIGFLAVFVRPVVSNHRPGLTIDPNLQLAAEALKTLCINSAECGINPFAWGGTVCCLKCSCEPSCITTHSCCPESGYHPTGDISYTSGREGMVCRNGIRVGTSLGVFIHPEYEFLQGCPPGTPTNVKDNCNRAFAVNDSSLIRSLPLYDTVRGINYANMYCALCNNASEGNLAPWKPFVSCDEQIDTSKLTLLEIEEKMFANECSIIFDPPQHDISDTVCFNDVITTCNVTGNWSTYDVTAEMFCEVLDMVYVSFEDRSRVFKNIFCAQCNGLTLGVFTMMVCPFTYRNDLKVSFASVLQFSVEDLNQYTDNGKQSTVGDRDCSENFAFDPLEGRCMPVYCSSPHVLDTAAFQCKTLFGETHNALAGHAFTVRFRESVNLEDARDREYEIMDTLMTTYIIICDVQVFYQSSLLTVDEVDDALLDPPAVTITALFINVRYIIIETRPDDERSSTRQIVESIFNDNMLYDYMGPETFDQGMLLYIAFVDGDAIVSRRVIAQFDMMNTLHYMFRNPYDGTILIGKRNNRAEKCVESMYKADYLQCPWFRYDATGFSKTISGLSLSIHGEVVQFGFDEFKTSNVNSTEIHICSQVVVDKTGHLVSYQPKHSLSSICAVIIFVCACVNCIQSILF